MSTNREFLRVGSHVINLSAINYVSFDSSPWDEGGEENIERAFVDFGNIDSDGWDLILTGEEAHALEAYFGQEGGGSIDEDDIQCQ